MIPEIFIINAVKQETFLFTQFNPANHTLRIVHYFGLELMQINKRKRQEI